jgi:hypothetical protein
MSEQLRIANSSLRSPRVVESVKGIRAIAGPSEPWLSPRKVAVRGQGGAFPWPSAVPDSPMANTLSSPRTPLSRRPARSLSVCTEESQLERTITNCQDAIYKHMEVSCTKLPPTKPRHVLIPHPHTPPHRASPTHNHHPLTSTTHSPFPPSR